MTGSNPRTGAEGTPARGARFSDLPEHTQRNLLKGIFGACQRWIVHTGLNRSTEAKLDDPGRKIAVLRQVANLSQDQLAKKAQVRQSDVSKAETNYGSVSYDKLERIARVLGTTFADLISQVPEDAKS